MDKKHGYVQRYRVVFDIRVPRGGGDELRPGVALLVTEVPDVGHDEHGGRVGARQAAQSIGKGGVHPCRGALLERQKFGFVVPGVAETPEIARVRQRRTPVVGETLEVGGRKRIQILPREGHDAVLAQRVEKGVDLFGLQRLAEIDSTDPDAGAAVGQGGFAAHIRAERLLQLPVDHVTHSPWTLPVSQSLPAGPYEPTHALHR